MVFHTLYTLVGLELCSSFIVYKLRYCYQECRILAFSVSLKNIAKPNIIVNHTSKLKYFIPSH